MGLRLATAADIEAMHRLRLSVRENRLTDPARVQETDYRRVLDGGGRGWVYELDGEIVGFGMADGTRRSIWALFVAPGFERRGIGRQLHDAMIEWLFRIGPSGIWLTTEPGTRAERFYAAAGWHRRGQEANGDIRLGLESLVLRRESDAASEYGRLLEDCVIASAWLKPGSVVVDSPEIFSVLNAASPFAFMNGVYRTRFRADAENQVLAHYRAFRDRGIPFRWHVFPCSTPANLAEILAALGPTQVMDMHGLVIETSAAIAELPTNITVEELSARNLSEYLETSTNAWGQDDVQAKIVRNEIRAEFGSGRMPYRAFLARCEGAAASTGIARVVGQVGYLAGGSTLPDFRRRGAYRALVAHRLRALNDAGVQSVLVHARKATSSPICRKLGFRVGCEGQSFFFG